MNRHLLNLWGDFWKNPSIKAGEDFEDFVADAFFPDDMYEMLHRTHDVNTNSKRFIRSSLNPDFQFEVRETGLQFWVECKHRENNYNDSIIHVFKEDQLNRYQSYHNCFLLLCTYRFDSQYMYFVPMWHIQYESLYLSFLKDYEIKMNPPIFPGLIEKYTF
jgi:hypothetical protein